MAGNNIDKNFWLAVFSLVGTTIGAGIFGLPYVFFKAGFFVGLIEILILSAIVVLIQLMVGEIALRIRGKKRILGYANEYLGEPWKKFLTFSIILASIGSLLAYLILAGNFISIIFGISVFLGTAIFFLVWFLALLLKVKSFGKAELYLSLFLIILVALIAILNIKYINPGNFFTFNFRDILLPYGVILFTVTGISVVPKMEELLMADKTKLRKAIIVGTLIPVAVCLLFAVIVMGISGNLTSVDAISGFAKALNSRVILIAGALIGLIAISQASLSFGLYFRETLWYDLKINKWLAWILTGFLPLALFMFGIRSFIKVISIIGSVFLGFQLIMILWMHKISKLSGLKPDYEIKLSLAVYWLLGILIAAGAILDTWYNFI